jgi:hypothetical protein
LLLEGPRGLLGFRPKWQPEDHRSFFNTAESWGLFVQRRQGNQQTEWIEVRYGTLRVRELVFELPAGADTAHTTLTVAGRTIPAGLRRDGNEARLTLDNELQVAEGETLELVWKW